MRDNFKMNENLYEDLGFPKDYDPLKITVTDLKTAKTKFIKELHPDKVRGAAIQQGIGGEALEKLLKESTEKLQRANAAYDILKNPNSRTRYDEFVLFSKSKAGTKTSGPHSKTYRAGASEAGVKPGSKTNGTYGHAGGGQGRRGRFNEDFWKDFGYYSRNQYQDFYEQLKQEIRVARAQGKHPNLQSLNLNFRDLSGMDLEGCMFGNILLDTNFSGANLKNASFPHAMVMNCIFDKSTKMDGIKFVHTDFMGAISFPDKMTNVDFRNAKFGFKAELNGIHFENCLFDNADGVLSNAKNCVFKGGSLKDIRGFAYNCSNSVFDNVNIKGADLEYARLHNITFKNMSFEGLDLSKAVLRDVKFEGSLKGLVLGEHQLAHVDFSKAEKAGLKVVNTLGKEVHATFTATGKAVPRAAGWARRIEEDAAGSFFRHEKGGLRFGRVATVSAAIIGAGAGLYYLFSREQQPNAQPENWVEKTRLSQNASQHMI